MRGRLTLRTDKGEASLVVSADGVSVDNSAGDPVIVIDVRRATLARLCCGAVPATAPAHLPDGPLLRRAASARLPIQPADEALRAGTRVERVAKPVADSETRRRLCEVIRYPKLIASVVSHWYADDIGGSDDGIGRTVLSARKDGTMAQAIERRNPRRRVRRLTAHVSPDVLRLVERAAAVSGRSVDRFLAEAAHEQAVATLRDHDVLVLSPEDSEFLFEVLRNPPEPSEYMIAAARRYRELVGAPGE